MKTRRIAFLMKLKEGCAAEYEHRHNQIWPELRLLLKKEGIEDYSIYLHKESGTLYGSQKVSGEGGSQDLSSYPLVQEWWKYMSDLMETNDDGSPVTIPLEKVFYLP